MYRSNNQENRKAQAEQGALGGMLGGGGRDGLRPGDNDASKPGRGLREQDKGDHFLNATLVHGGVREPETVAGTGSKADPPGQFLISLLL